MLGPLAGMYQALHISLFTCKFTDERFRKEIQVFLNFGDGSHVSGLTGVDLLSEGEATTSILSLY